MKHIGGSLLALLTLLCGLQHARAIPGLEPQRSLRYSGYIKLLASHASSSQGLTVNQQFLHQRLNLEWQPNSAWLFYGALRNRWLFGDALPSSLGDDAGYWDLVYEKEGDGYRFNSHLDRLYAQYRYANWQARLGRQRINWGISTAWNPNDLFNSFSLFDFDYEEKPGTDGLLLKRTLGVADSVELMWAFAKNRAASSLALRYRLNRRGYDIQFIAGQRQADWVLGGGWAGALGGWGWHGEWMLFQPRAGEEESRANHTLTSGADYLFSNQLLLKLGLLYNARPAAFSAPEQFLNGSMSAKQLSFSRWTGFVALSYPLTALQTLGLESLLYADRSYYLSLSHSVSLADDWELQLSAQHFSGPADSLFGKLGSTQWFARLRWSY